MIVGTLKVTDRFVFRDYNKSQWVRVSQVVKFNLRATKGYLKDGPIETTTETSSKHARPRDWRRERLREFHRR